MTNNELIYEILKRVDDSNNSQEKFNFEKVFDYETLNITEKKLDLLLRNLISDGYIDGINMRLTSKDNPIYSVNNPRLTFFGLNFLDNYRSEIANKQNSKETMPPSNTTNIHIENIYGISSIDNKGNITYESGASISDLKELLTFISTEDKAEVGRLIEQFEDLEQNPKPVPKGFLSKFENLFNKYPNLTNVTKKILFKFFL